MRARVSRGKREGRLRRECRAASLAEVRAAETGGEGRDSSGSGGIEGDSREVKDCVGGKEVGGAVCVSGGVTLP